MVGPDAGVPGQEDRRPGDEARLACTSSPRRPLVLIGTAAGGRSPGAGVARLNPGPHGLSEVLYAFTSAGNNNGSRLRRAQREHRLVQHRARPGDAARPVPADRVRAGPGRSPRPAEARPGSPGHAAHPPPAVRRPARRCRRPRRRPHLLPGLRARPARGGTLDDHPDPCSHPGTCRRNGPPGHSRRRRACSTRRCCVRSLPDALRKLDPRTLCRNPVMFVVEVGAVFTTVARRRRPVGVRLGDRRLAVADRALRQPGRGRGRGARQGAGATLRQARTETIARRLVGWRPGGRRHGRGGGRRAPSLRLGDVVVVEAGQVIPGDGDVVEGVASVDESAITGESAPVIRESGGDRAAVTGGTKVLSDRIVVRITAKPGRDLHRPDDRPGRGRRPAEDAERDRAEHPARRADDRLPAARSSPCSRSRMYCRRRTVPVVVLVALLVCLIPTTIGALLSAIGIAGMDRLVQRNVLAMSGRAVEAAGDVNTLLLDKTGTITLGNRQAAEFLPAAGVERCRAGRRRAAGQPRRRDARGPLDRGAGQDRLRPARAGRPASSRTPASCRSPRRPG